MVIAVVVVVVVVPWRTDVDGEAAPGFVSVCVGGLVEDMVTARSEVVPGQKRRHHVLDLDIVLSKGKFKGHAIYFVK